MAGRRRVVVWQADGEPVPGTGYGAPLAAALRRIGLAPTVVPLDRRPPSADELSAELHVVSGGDTPADADVPWLSATRRALDGVVARALDGDAVVVGVCLGAQLLATALAGRGTAGPSARGMEAGLREVVAADPDRIPPVHVVAEFHHHVIDPDRLTDAGGRVVLTNDHTPVQAFRAGRGVHGLQFHPEFDPDLTRATMRANAPLLRATGADPDEALRSVDRLADRWTPRTFDTLVGTALRSVAPASARRRRAA